MAFEIHFLHVHGSLPDTADCEILCTTCSWWIGCAITLVGVQNEKAQDIRLVENERTVTFEHFV
jgi:hypothetical protein